MILVFLLLLFPGVALAQSELEKLANVTEAERIKSYAADCQASRESLNDRLSTFRAYILKLEDYAKRLETQIQVQQKGSNIKPTEGVTK